jgi:aryl-alcohol dehydrogenase-like predicted oxidoreductase
MDQTMKIGGELEINRLGFGAMRITGKGIWGPPEDRAGAIALLKHVVESGCNFIDTADSYGPNVSEDLIGEALAPYKKGLVIATKVGLTRPGPNQWVPDCRPERIMACCEGSLQRLKLETIDLYQLHRIDSKVPLADQIGALLELKSQGKIRHIGLSEVSPEELAEVQKMTPIASVQNEYNLANRKSEATLAACETQNIAFIPWFPLGGGDTSALEAKLQPVADRLGATPHQVALAWLLQRSPVMVPIPGTSSIEHFDENMGALEIDLGDAEMEKLAA